MKKYYLAYGSNLNIDQMKYRCPNARIVGKTKLDNHRLVFKGGYTGYLTIEEAEGNYVPLGIYEITSNDEKKLDLYEGYPNFYYKKYIPVEINSKTVYALIYVMNEEFGYQFPTMDYINICKSGYRDFSFDNHILSEALETTMLSISKTLKK